jgi:sugar lactone lactonase YvrE
MLLQTKTLLVGLGFGESPRWHNNKLWFSDMQLSRVMAADLDGKVEKVVEVPGHPSGLGWLPDGRLLVVSMIDKRLLRLDQDGLVEVADLSGLASGCCNDMVVDVLGRSYIGNFGLNTDLSRQVVGPAEIILVTPDGESRIVASDLIFPNGSVITPDGGTLIVAETFASCLTAFDIEPDGSLSGKRVWAKLENGTYPDGICLDAEGAIWIANAYGHEVMRIRKGGQVTHHVKLSAHTFACMLGGPDGCTLFILAIDTNSRVSPGGRVEMVRVEAPGAGLP